MAKLNLLGNKLFFRSRLLGVAILLLGSLILFLYFSLSGLLKTKNKFVNEIAYYAKMSNEVSRLNNELEYITNQQQQYLLYEISGNTTQFRLKVDFEKTDSEFSILKELVQKNEDIHFYNEIHDIYLKMKSIQVRISESIFLDEVIQAITISKNELTPSVEVFNSKVGDYLNYLEKEIHSSRENLDKFVVFKVWQIIICSVLFLAFIFYVIIRIQTDLDFELKRLENDLYKLSKGDILTIKPVIVFHEFARVNSLVADVAAFWKNVDGNIEALSAEKGGYFFMNKLSDREQISTRLNIIASINQNRVTEIESLQTRFQRTEWIFNGLRLFNDIFTRLSPNVEELGNSVLQNLVSYLQVPQAGFYILEQDTNGRYLRMIANYAFDHVRIADSIIQIGEGLLGAAVIEREITYHANLPEGFFRISSGMGIHDAKNLLMVPLLHNENVVGVIEIASFKSIDSVAIDFIKQIALGIAVAISTVQENHRNRSILAQANSSIDYTKNDLLRLKNKLDETNIELQEVLGREVEMARFIRAVDSTVLIVEITHTGEIIQVNHYFEVLTGYLSGVVKGSLFTVLLRNLDVLNLFKGNEPVHFPESEVVELLTHDGTVVCILASIVWSTIYQNRAYFVAVDISRIHVKNLKTIQLVSTLKDKQEQVNKRIRALEVENILLKKVKHSEKSLAALVWQQYIVAKFDVDWKFVEANSAFNLFFKVTSSSLISKSILDFFESDHTDRLVILSKSLAAGNYHKETLVVKLFDSSDHKWMRLSYAPVFDIDGLLVNYFVLFEDMDPMVRHENVLSNVISQNEVLAARIVALEIEIQSKGLSVHEDSIKSLNVEVEKIYDLLDLKSAENSDLIKKIDILSSENDNLKLIQAKLATEKNTLNMRLASKQSQLDSELAASALLGSKYDGIVLELENTSAKLTENNKELCRLLDLIHSVSGESVAGSLHSDVIEQKRWLDWYKSQSS